MYKAFFKISKYSGMREDLVQAGGGNSSVKISDSEMLIKASGYQMAEITDTEGFSKVNYRAISEFMYNNSNTVLSEDAGKKVITDNTIEGKRPSIETFLHAITKKVTLHTHPILVNVMLARKDGMKILKKLFPEALFVGYATPGIKLAQTYVKSYMEAKGDTNKEFNIIFLKNHGLVVSADNAEDVIYRTENVLSKIRMILGKQHLEPFELTTHLYDKLSSIGLIPKNKILYYSTDKYIYDYLQKNSNVCIPLCPDSLIYMNRKCFVIKDNTALNGINNDGVNKFICDNGYPAIIIYKNMAYIVAANVKKAKEIECVLRFNVMVSMLDDEDELDPLSIDEQNCLLNLESEKYRQNMK